MTTAPARLLPRGAWSLLAALSRRSAGCTTIREARGGPGQRLDPWENWNRKVFSFNEDLDSAVLKPVATVYTDVVPQPVRRGVSNFFGNFADAWSAINNMLQGKIAARLRGRDARRHQHAVRPVRHPRRRLRDGPRPPLRGLRPDARPLRRRRRARTSCCRCSGPSTVRDAAALPLDRLASPPAFFDGTGTQIGFIVLQIVNTRAGLLGATRVHRRHLARQVHLRSRRLPAASAQPGLRRRRARDAGRARGGRVGRRRRGGGQRRAAGRGDAGVGAAPARRARRRAAAPASASARLTRSARCEPRIARALRLTRLPSRTGFLTSRTLHPSFARNSTMSMTRTIGWLAAAALSFAAAARTRRRPRRPTPSSRRSRPTCSTPSRPTRRSRPATSAR